MSVLIHLYETGSKRKLVDQSPQEGDLVYLVNRSSKDETGSQPPVLAKFMCFEKDPSSFEASWAFVLVSDENSLREDKIVIPYSTGVERNGERRVLACDAYKERGEILEVMKTDPETEPYASWFEHFLR